MRVVAVGGSLVALFGIWQEIVTALSLAVISCSIISIRPSRVYPSPLTCRLTIRRSSCGNLFKRTDINKLPYDSAATPRDLSPLPGIPQCRTSALVPSSCMMMLRAQRSEAHPCVW